MRKISRRVFLRGVCGTVLAAGLSACGENAAQSVSAAVSSGAASGSSSAGGEALTLAFAPADSDSKAEGFVCVVSSEGTVFSDIGKETFAQILSANNLADDDKILKVAVVPDNTETYPYLYPEKDWKALFFAEDAPDWFTDAFQLNVQTAFETWKQTVYGCFDYTAVRELTADSTLSKSPDDTYTASDEDIRNFREYININNSLCTYIKTSVNDTIESAVGSSVAGNVWNYVNRDIGEQVKQAGKIGDILTSMGVSNVGVVQNDFSGGVTGGFFTLDTWKYYDGKLEGYPYQCTVYLWEHGLAVSEDSSSIWRLHCANGGRILCEIPDEQMSTSNAFACVVGKDGTLYWGAGEDNCSDILTANNLSADDCVSTQVKPVLDQAKASLSLPDGNNPDVTRYFPYLDSSSVWTLSVLDEQTPDWFTDAMSQSVMDAFAEWKTDIYGNFNFEDATKVFTDSTKEAADYTEDDVALLSKWAAAWHNLKDQGMDPTAAIKLSGFQSIGSSVWKDFDAYLLAAWRVQHEACPGDVVQAGYFAAQGITDKEKYDHQIGDVVGDSVSDVMESLAGYFFPTISKWAYYTGDASTYPFAAGATLILHQLVPYTDGEKWYLASGKDADIQYQIAETDLFEKYPV